MKRYLSDVSHLPPLSYWSYQLPWQPDKVLWPCATILELLVLLTCTHFIDTCIERKAGVGRKREREGEETVTFDHICTCFRVPLNRTLTGD